jgi:uncharacterized protein YndB with AHSA1/START domain
MSTEQAVVRLQRTIPATAERVYRAWLDPELLQRWLAPASLAVDRVEVDERIGGHHRTFQVNADGEAVGGFDCELLELIPTERIVFRWGFVGPERVADPDHESRLTISLREVSPGSTELTLLHERLDALDAAMPGMASATAQGWGMALDKLAQAIGR